MCDGIQIAMDMFLGVKLAAVHLIASALHDRHAVIIDILLQTIVGMCDSGPIATGAPFVAFFQLSRNVVAMYGSCCTTTRVWAKCV